MATLAALLLAEDRIIELGLRLIVLFLETMFSDEDAIMSVLVLKLLDAVLTIDSVAGDDGLP